MKITNNLTINSKNLLYVTDTNDLQQYQIIVNHYFHLLDKEAGHESNRLNVFITIYDIWIALRSYHETFFLDQKKCMSYPFAALQLKTIEQNVALKNFIHTNKLNAEQTFILSYFLSIELMNWISTMMHREGQAALLEDYIPLANLPEQLDESYFIQEMNNQTIFVKVMMQNIRETHDLHFVISTAITNTKNYLQSII